MKIIHCSDLHLDSKMQANFDSGKAKERRDEILRTYQKMVEYAAKNDVKIILIAGDMFDKKDITTKAKNVVLNSICANPQIDFIYLKGNHDEASFITELEEIPSNLKLFNSNEWQYYRYGNLVIAGIEFGKVKNYEMYSSLMLNKSDINIVLLHGQESKYDQKDSEGINIQSLKNKNIDYLALGHIHKYKKEAIDTRGVYCYSGCLEGRGFDECGEKGFVLLNVDEENKKISSEFIPFAHRKLYAIDVDITGTLTNLDAERKIDEQVKDIEKEALVKIVLKGKVEIDSERDIKYLEKKYKEMFYFAKIYDETNLKVDYMSYENDASLKGEFIRLILRQDGISDEGKKKIIICGIKALSGEEVDE